MKKNKFIIYPITILIVILLCISIKMTFFSYDYKLETNNHFSNNNIEVKEEIDYNKQIDDLKKKYKNKDVKGILEIPNTDYIVPIMQSDDNDYYLNHTPDKKKNFMGSIYLDYRVDIEHSKKILIYGHNSSRIDMPFKILENYYDELFYKQHKYVEITTPNNKNRYEVVSVYVETSDFDYMNINYNNIDEYFKHITKLKDKSMYDTGVELTESDEILILQTCSTHKDYSKYKKKYLLIILKKI